MSVQVAYDSAQRVAVMYCNTSDTAFGPIFTGHEAQEKAEAFLEWLSRNVDQVSSAVASPQTGDVTDPRDYPPDELERVVNHWRQTQDGE